MQKGLPGYNDENTVSTVISQKNFIYIYTHTQWGRIESPETETHMQGELVLITVIIIIQWVKYFQLMKSHIGK